MVRAVKIKFMDFIKFCKLYMTSDVFSMEDKFMFGFSSISEFIMFFIVIVISLVFHEFSHGLASYLQGDDTAKNEGRLTLNPFAHIDPIGLLIMIPLHFGWAKPVPYSSSHYKNRRLGIIITSAAGPLANFIIAVIAIFISVIIDKFQNPLLSYFIYNLISINLTLLIFNLIPIPPLDGSKIFGEIFGGRVADFIYRIDRRGMYVLLLLLWFTPINNVLGYLINQIYDPIYKLAFTILVR